ncbi:hypothetical protein C0J52_20465 [Blattella germanica]|nr:hypothetical protein C0J52_20465 [Blattella germanica]
MGSQDVGHGHEPELVPLQSEKENKSTRTKLSQLRGRTLLLRYLHGSDWLLLSVGTIFALLHGICFPLVTLILGHMTDILLSQAEQRCNETNSTTEFLSQYDEGIDDYEELSIENLLQNSSAGLLYPQQLLDIFKSETTSVSQEEFEDLLSLLSALIGLFVFIAAFVQPFCWDLCSSRRVNRLRIDLFHKILRQEMSWYDTHKDKEIVTAICRHVDVFRHGTGSKLGMLLQYTVTCSSGFIVAIYANWRLTLFIFPLFFLCLVVPHLLYMVYLDFTTKGYAEAGQVAEEVFSNLHAHDDADGHGVELNCYREALQVGQKGTLKKYYTVCSSILAAYLVASAVMAVALWQNWKLIEMGCLAPGAVATVFFSVIVVMLSTNKVLCFGAALMSAKRSAFFLRDIIDNVSPAKKITSHDNNGKITGKLEFKDVSFNYPTGYKNQVLFDNTPSAPPNGIAVISFDPKLFNNLSVLDNIQLGVKDVQFNQVVQAAIDVGVHGYIPGLEMGYDTPFRENFTEDLKQRIALARVILQNPRILIIDDITPQHAVDIQSKRRLIETFHKVMDSRTTIVLSQRLPIVQHANKIYILEVNQENGKDDKQRKMSEFVFEPESVKQNALPNTGYSTVCLNSPDWPWLTFGLISHIVTGLGLPAFARLFGDIFVPREELPRTSQIWGYMVLVIATIVGVSFWLQVAATRICEVIGAATSMVAAMVAAFLHGWKMELVLLLVFPAIALAAHMKSKTLTQQQLRQHKLMKAANNVMAECVEKIQTLRVLGGEKKFETLYAKKLIVPYQ